MEYKWLIMPINPKEHWLLLAANLETCEVTILDSLHNDDRREHYVTAWRYEQDTAVWSFQFKTQLWLNVRFSHPYGSPSITPILTRKVPRLGGLFYIKYHGCYTTKNTYIQSV